MPEKKKKRIYRRSSAPARAATANDKLSRGDEIAVRTKQPGTQPQKPATTTTVTSADGTRILGRATMNYKGVAGGVPERDADKLRRRAAAYSESGEGASAAAAKKRAENIEGHDRMTKKTRREIARSLYRKSNHK